MRSLVMVCLAAGISGTLCAQVVMGLKAGCGYSIWTMKDNDPAKGSGFHGGLYVQAPVTEAVTFQPELLYVPRGVKESVQRTTSTWENGSMTTVREEGEAKIKTAYMELPLLIGLSLGQRLRVHVGPVLAWRTSYAYTQEFIRTTTVNGSTSTQAYHIESNDDSNLKALDYDVAVGLYYEDKSGLNIGARYVHGLASMAFKSPQPIKYNGVQISAGITFGGR